MNEGRVGLIGPAADGSLIDHPRIGRFFEQMISNLRGKYAEQAARGLIMAVSTAVTGTTVAAGNVAPPAAAAATVLSLYNPMNSGVDLEVLKVFLQHISGTPGAGAWMHCLSYSPAITATENAAPACSNGGTDGAAKGFTQTALTGGAVHTNYRAFGGMFAGAIAATTPGQFQVDDVDGEIILPPGYVLSIAAPAAGTSHVVAASIVFAEVPRP